MTEEMTQQVQLPKKKRIEYIDLMKGICIILIILLHLGIDYGNHTVDVMLKNMRIPLYFCLSGLFFKEYDGFLDFVTRKINKLIIPFVFFSYFPFALCELGRDNYDRSVTTYIIMGLEPYNYPLWFLRCLFITYILYFIFVRVTKNKSSTLGAIGIFVLAFLAYCFVQVEWSVNSMPALLKVVVFDNVLTAFIALPFFHIAYMVRKKGFLSQVFEKKQILAFFVMFFIIWFLTFQEDIDYKTVHFGTNFFFLYTGALGGIGCVWCIAYLIKKLFYVSYVGRYSIIALGTHYPMILLFRWMGIQNKYLIFLCILLVMPGVIYLFKKYFAYFTAQKDLFVWKDGKFKWAIKK